MEIALLLVAKKVTSPAIVHWTVCYIKYEILFDVVLTMHLR